MKFHNRACGPSFRRPCTCHLFPPSQCGARAGHTPPLLRQIVAFTLPLNIAMKLHFDRQGQTFFFFECQRRFNMLAHCRVVALLKKSQAQLWMGTLVHGVSLIYILKNTFLCLSSRICNEYGNGIFPSVLQYSMLTEL